MISRITLNCLLAGILCLLLTGCDADFMKSDKRIVERRVVLYQALLSQGKFQDAAKQYHSKSFIWEKFNSDPKKKKKKKKVGKKRNDSKIFMMSLSDIDDRTAIYVHVNSVKKITKDKYVVLGAFQIRGNTASSQSNTRFQYSILWVRSGKDKWRITELKELTKRMYKRS